MIQIRNVLQKPYRGRTVFVLTSRKTESAKYAREPRLQGLLARSALVMPYLVQKMLVIWWQQITKSSMKEVNLETNTETQSWYKIQALNGYNLIRDKQKLLSRRTRVFDSFSSRRKSQKSFVLTFPWNLANPVKNYHGNIGHQRPIDPRRMVLLRERYVEQGRNFCSTVATRLGRKMVGGFHRMFLLSARCSRPSVRRENSVWKTIWRTIRRANNSFWSNGWTSSDFSERFIKISSVLPGIFLGYELIAGENWKGDVLIADLEDLEKLDASEIYPPRINAKEVFIT